MKLLECHFDAAFGAPDGIRKLRELILTLAMRGKLVPQNPNDPPASELLRKIEAEKKQLMKGGKIKAPKPLSAITPEEVPHALPQGWEWVRLGVIADYNGRGNVGPESISPDTWLLDLEDVEKGTSALLHRAKYGERQSKSTKSTFKADDVLYGKLRPYLDKVIVADADGVCTTEIVPIVPSDAVDPQFLRWMLKRPAFLAYVNALMYGVKMPRLGTEDATKSIHPLPPLPEQSRIVAKIDQLMARCDELEKLRAKRQQKRLSVHTAALKALLAAQEQATFDSAWLFLTRHFGELYSVKENVTELRKAILQLAVMGKLSSPMPTDRSTASLLRELLIAQLNNSSHSPKEKAAIQTELSEAIGLVRENRALLKARLFCDFITKGTTPAASELTDSGEIPFLKVYNIVGNTLAFNYKPIFISEKVHRGRLKRSIVYPNDVIMNIVGPPLGKVAVVTGQYAEWNMNQALAVFRPLAGILSKYIYYVLSTGSVLESALREVKGTAGQDNLSLEQCRDVILPIPSIEEQRRIVSTIDHFMALCETLEQQIDAATRKQTELLNAVMAQV